MCWYKLAVCVSSQVESELLSMLASLAVSEAAAVLSSHTQLLVCRQEWDELQLDVLAKVSMSCPYVPYLMSHFLLRC